MTDTCQQKSEFSTLIREAGEVVKYRLVREHTLHLLDVEPGDGLLIAGNARVPIRGKFPSGNVLYDLFSTNPNETKKTGLGDKKDAKPVI